ncbi:MAG TPA: L-threonylcarbamoyladenylate synthase [Pyrinomonadaceae bacterium]|nr:L-threonylcarbamoyladenylate synthase [Pyrinomonadaceae bacterium]
MVLSTQLTTDPHIAAEVIRSGGIVAFPTETVYGLGADIFNKNAIEKIFEAKQRPADNPLIAHVSSLDQVDLLSREVSASAKALIDAFFPGPLTVVLKRSDRVPNVATAGLDTIGIRMPGHGLARQFLTACNAPVAAPSANLSGRPSPTTWQAVFEDLNGRIDCILQGDPTEIGLESTVVDCTVDPPLLLRKGAVSIEELREWVPEIRTEGTNDTELYRSPGLRHKHYRPKAKVMLIGNGFEPDKSSRSAYIGLDAPAWDSGRTVICGSVDDYARRVFAFFRECDQAGIETIYCQRVDETGIGSALMDRLLRAAAD